MYEVQCMSIEWKKFTHYAVAKGRLSAIHDPASRGPDIASEVLSKNQLSPQISMSGFSPLTHPIPEDPVPTMEDLHPIPEDPIPITDDLHPVPEDSSAHASNDSVAGKGDEKDEVEEAGVGKEEERSGRDMSLEVDVIVAGSGGEEEKEEGEEKKLEPAVSTEDDTKEVNLGNNPFSQNK